MFLGLDKLLDLVKDPQIELVENLSERELTHPEGTGFDFRIGKLSQLTNQQLGYLGIDERQTTSSIIISEVNESLSGPTVELLPYQYYLGTTIEKVNMPLDLFGIFYPRSTLFRSGVNIYTSQINPGYTGTITFGIFNATPFVFKLDMGARVIHLLVARIDGNSSPYRGQWQGGRISANLETQV